MKAIRVKSEAEFDRLRDRIDLETSHARHHWDLLKGLQAAANDYYLEMNESNTFWYLTFIARRDAVLSHLCRIYDKNHGALSLGSFLLTVRANREFFSDSAFRHRLKDNLDVDTLAKDRNIDDAELDREIASVSHANPVVSRLWNLRDTVVSHSGADQIRRNEPTASNRWLPTEDVEALLNVATDITSTYSLLYKASVYGGIAGARDYEYTLKWVRKALQTHRAQINQEIEEIALAGT